MPHPPDEPELLRAAAAGDRRAFDELVRRKRERVVRTAYQITGQWDDALDVAQGVFLKVWQGLDRYDPRHALDTWLYRITVNAAIDQLRARAARGGLHVVPDLDPDAIAGKTEAPAAALDRRTIERAFLELARELAPRQRAVFVLREIEGLEAEEIAEVLGIAASTVRNHLMQARRILREGIEKRFPELVPGGTRREGSS
jgi:RNA polymerase sigma-70 factor, ECF subfamily